MLPNHRSATNPAMKSQLQYEIKTAGSLTRGRWTLQL